MTADEEKPVVPTFQIWQCLSEACRFRYPAVVGYDEGCICPRCHGPAFGSGAPFVGRSLSPANNNSTEFKLEVLLDNVRSSHNVGSIFRSCDGAGVSHIHLCGITSTPTQPKVVKSALGAEKTVSWSYYRNGVDAIQSLKQQGLCIWSLENRRPNLSLFDLQADDLYEPLLLVVGNELAGVDPTILDLSDRVVSLPMLGRKGSLNVAVALGIVAYWLRYGIRRGA